MACKRKFDAESDDLTPTKSKQLKLVPFPNYEPNTDVTMSDAEPDFAQPRHTRIPSNASSLSSNASNSPTFSPLIVYPSFDLYPLPFFNGEGFADRNSHNYSNYSSPMPSSHVVGLLQPSSPFVHHGTNCSQIPKLRVACAAGSNGQRTMWSFCEQCGSISMVDSD